MKTFLTIILISIFVLNISCGTGGNTTGFIDDFTGVEGWYEVTPDRDTISPTLKMESVDDLLIIHHKFRTLEEAYKKWDWIKNKIDYSTNLRKNLGEIDLDKYHYVVLNVKEKGSSSYFDINGFTTKLGYTTGITAINLKDYPDECIHGKQKVDFGIDLQDNHTHLTLDYIKFVSKLEDGAKGRLIGPGLTIREEKLKPKPYHGLEALKLRENIALPSPDGEEMAIFRDDATGGITTRLTDAPGDDYFGEGGIWSADGAAVKFKSARNVGGVPLYLPANGLVVAGPPEAGWSMWSQEDPDLLYVMKRKGMDFSVSSWNRRTEKSSVIADFRVPEIGSFVEFKRFTPLGNIIVAFRETPNLYIVDVHNQLAKYIKLSTRLKDVYVYEDEKIVMWYNCYTFEARWRNMETGEEGLAPSFSAGHASWGKYAMVANFGGYLNVFVPDDIGMTFTPGDRISIWANWSNEIITDYGRLTIDNKYVFTNGNRGDVDHQHLMIRTGHTGSVMRVACYFTKFSWTSTTYSRPSPDYTKLIYNENVLGSTELFMVYTRRPDAPAEVSLDGKILTWKSPARNREIKGYNIYASNQSGRNFIRINKEPILNHEYAADNKWKYHAITAIEHSGLESSLSREVSLEGPRSYYFEAEEMELVPPVRRFFDGYCNNFQCVRINAESEMEKTRPGVVRIPLGELSEGPYRIWIRVKGIGEWSAGSASVLVSTEEWKWIQLGTFSRQDEQKSLDISSDDDALKLDLVLLTGDDFIPKAPYPMDNVPPKRVEGLIVRSKDKQIQLSWDPVNAPDLHHYSVYCGNKKDFRCDNETIIRSVFKTSVTDALPEKSGDLFYKVIAFDNRWNRSEPAMVGIR